MIDIVHINKRMKEQADIFANLRAEPNTPEWTNYWNAFFTGWKEVEASFYAMEGLILIKDREIKKLESQLKKLGGAKEEDPTPVEEAGTLDDLI